MKRIDNETVRLTEAEQCASNDFDIFLDEGHSVPKAVELTKEHHPRLSEEFYHYLEGTKP